MQGFRIRPEDRLAIARAILADEVNPNGEHRYDGEQLAFYCPMQSPAGDVVRGVPVRDLLPDDVQIPALAGFIQQRYPDLRLAMLSASERANLVAHYETETATWLAGLLR